MTRLRSLALGLTAMFVPSLATASLVQSLNLAELTARAEAYRGCPGCVVEERLGFLASNTFTRASRSRLRRLGKGRSVPANASSSLSRAAGVGNIEMGGVHGMPASCSGKRRCCSRWRSQDSRGGMSQGKALCALGRHGQALGRRKPGTFWRWWRRDSLGPAAAEFLPSRQLVWMRLREQVRRAGQAVETPRDLL